MVQQLSLITTPLFLQKDDKSISAGTGFFYSKLWKGNNYTFLITNYHVLTGNDPKNRTIKPQGDSVIFYYHTDKKKPNIITGIKIPLFCEKKPAWLEHPNKNVDIAAIPITFSLPTEFTSITINQELAERDIEVAPSDDVMLIGYPRMYLDKKNVLPIYKSGNIASEPNYDFNGDPCFIIDISAFAGNSGSPVFAIRRHAYANLQGEITLPLNNGDVKFLGVYSAGMEYKVDYPVQVIQNDRQQVIIPHDMGLGIVWKAHLISELICDEIHDEYVNLSKKLVQQGNFKFMLLREFIDFR